MAVEFEVADINGVDESIRKAYVEKEGKYTLDPDRYHEIKAEPLIKKNAELLNEKKQLQQSTKTLEEKSKTGLSDIEKQLQERDREIAGLKNQVREFSIWSPVKDLAIKHGVMADRVDAVMTLLRTNERFDMEGSNLVFKDRNGYATTITPQRAFEVYLREELPWAFEASKAAGSGANNNGRTSGPRVISRESFNSMSAAQREAAVKDGARIID